MKPLLSPLTFHLSPLTGISSAIQKAASVRKAGVASFAYSVFCCGCDGFTASSYINQKPQPQLRSLVSESRFSLAERKGFEPLLEDYSKHDFQSCALDQLSHLSTGQPHTGDRRFPATVALWRPVNDTTKRRFCQGVFQTFSFFPLQFSRDARCGGELLERSPPHPSRTFKACIPYCSERKHVIFQYHRRILLFLHPVRGMAAVRASKPTPAERAD